MTATVQSRRPGKEREGSAIVDASMVKPLKGKRKAAPTAAVQSRRPGSVRRAANGVLACDTAGPGAVGGMAPEEQCGVGAHLRFMQTLGAEGVGVVSGRCENPKKGKSASEEPDECDKAQDCLVEFFDLLKSTAPEDVRLIDDRLRAQMSGALPAELKRFESANVERVWDVASTLTSVDEESLQVGHRLQVLSASQTSWGRCLVAAEVAGELLRRRLKERQEEKGQRTRRAKDLERKAAARGAVAAETEVGATNARENGADYFAKRMAPLVEEEGTRGQQLTKSDLLSVTFYNRELKMAYTDLCLQVQCSNFMARQCGEVAYALDAEVKIAAATTDDSLLRYDTALGTAQALYPFAERAGTLLTGPLMSYDTFRMALRLFLMTYKEFFLLGEVLFEAVPVGKRAEFKVVTADGRFGYRVRGSRQGEAGELRYAYWTEQLGNLSASKISARVKHSRDLRLEMAKEVLGQKSERAKERAKEKEQAELAAGTPAVALARAVKNAKGRCSAVVEKKKKKAPPPLSSRCAPAKARSQPVTKKRPAPPSAGRSAPKKQRAVASKTVRATARTSGSSRSASGSDTGAGVAQVEQGRTAEGVAAKILRSTVTESTVGREGEDMVTDGSVAAISCAVSGGVEVEAEEEEEAAVRDPAYDYVLVAERPSNARYFSVVMMKGAAEKPRTGKMVDELRLPDAGDHVNQYVSVEAGGKFTYLEVSSLTHNLHGTHDADTRRACLTAAETNGVASLCVPCRGSYISREVSVLHDESAEFGRLAAVVGGLGLDQDVANDVDVDTNAGASGASGNGNGDLAGDLARPLGFDAGEAVEGMVNFVRSKECTSDVAERILDGRGNLQRTFGVSNHNYLRADEVGAAPAGIGEAEIAGIGLQSERVLHQCFFKEGRGIGAVVAKLAAVRDALARERGDEGRENNDFVRNQLHSGNAAEMCGRHGSLGVENFTLALTGDSQLLKELSEELVKKLPHSKRDGARHRWMGTGSVETGDHGDVLNPNDPAYSRVIIAKWRMHLNRDNPGEVLVLSIIANFRLSVEVYEVKMKGIRALSAWFERTVRERREEEAAAENIGIGGGQVAYGADEEFAAEGGSLVRVGFLPTETHVDRKTFSKHGCGAFVSYSQPLVQPRTGGTGLWKRHRDNDLQEMGSGADSGDDDDDDATEPEEGHRVAEGVARLGEGIGLAGWAAEQEVGRLAVHATLYGELWMNRADHDRFADLSGCIWVTEELRDRFKLNLSQAEEVAMCIFWHTRSRALFLLKGQALLDATGPYAAKFQRAAENGPEGSVGHFIMEEMVPSKYLSRVATELVRTKLGFLVWKDRAAKKAPGEESKVTDSFTVDFVAEQQRELHAFLRAAECLSEKMTTADFLDKRVKLAKLRHVGQFAVGQVLPVCYMLSLTNVHARRAAEAPILDKGKKHYKKFLELGVEASHMDLAILVVALQFFTVPLTVENTGCEKFREQNNVHDFMVPGQMYYGMRPVPGCNYRHPQFTVHVKKWGSRSEWVEAVRDEEGRWRHPGREGVRSNDSCGANAPARWI